MWPWGPGRFAAPWVGARHPDRVTAPRVSIASARAGTGRAAGRPGLFELLERPLDALEALAQVVVVPAAAAARGLHERGADRRGDDAEEPDAGDHHDPGEELALGVLRHM